MTDSENRNRLTATSNLWAPWRVEYLKALDRPAPDDEAGGCFLCRYWDDPANDEENLVLWRSETALVVFNRFPYTNGHLLIAPAQHVATLNALNDQTVLEIMRLATNGQQVLTEAIGPQGFNMGFNFNRCAGAGLPDHLHMHLVPRWNGDTNFMSVLTDTRVIGQSLDALYRELKKLSEEKGLPAL
jgi:ATP adenylyltransferase